MNLAEAFDDQAIDWDQARSHLDERGFVVIPGVLSRKICEEIAAYYADDRRFRSTALGKSSHTIPKSFRTLRSNATAPAKSARRPCS